MNKCIVTFCNNNTGFGDCMYPDIKECNTRDQSNMRKVYEQGVADAIDEVLPLIKDIRGLCRQDVLNDLIRKVKKLKEKHND